MSITDRRAGTSQEHRQIGDAATPAFGIATIIVDGRAHPAVTTERGALRLAALLGAGSPASVGEMIEDWDATCDRIAAAMAAGDHEGAWTAAADVEFAPPLMDPPTVYCSGANFYDHVAEMGKEPPDKTVEDAFHFLVPAASMTGHGHHVARPAGVTRLDWEVELVAVIGRRADRVRVEDALDYVAGYTVANDVSVRDPWILHPIFGVRWVASKGQATLTPIGPSIVPARFVADPMRLAITTHVNGEVRQHSSTDQMIWTLQEQIATLSRQVPLVRGDLILTGTPAGTAAARGRYLADGDVMAVAVEGVGRLVNVVAPSPVA